MKRDDVQALTVRLPRDLHQALRVRAVLERRSAAAIITDLVQAYLAKHQTHDEPKGSSP